MATTAYVAAPFIPWWDVASLGEGPLCERCGAQMVRLPHPNPDSISGDLLILHEYRPAGWGCISCKNYHADGATAARGR